MPEQKRRQGMIVRTMGLKKRTKATGGRKCDHGEVLQTRTREARPVVEPPQVHVHHDCLHLVFDFVVLL